MKHVNIKIYSLIFAALVSLSGCATTANFEKMLSTWVGVSEENLISRWGPPTRAYASGRTKYLTFDKSATGYVPGTPPTYSTTVIGNTAYTNTHGGTSGYVYTKNCSTTFTITNGVVSSWRWEGNACRM
jgi:hypothetical protein